MWFTVYSLTYKTIYLTHPVRYKTVLGYDGVFSLQNVSCGWIRTVTLNFSMQVFFLLVENWTERQKCLNSFVFWFVTQRRMVKHRRFGITYWSRLEGHVQDT